MEEGAIFQYVKVWLPAILVSIACIFGSYMVLYHNLKRAKENRIEEEKKENSTTSDEVVKSEN
ncbi:MAG: hypothetical protein ACI86H_002259 [bacterium]|jgi:hypothetical protein